MGNVLDKPPILKFTPDADKTLEDLIVDLFGKKIIDEYERRIRTNEKEETY